MIRATPARVTVPRTTVPSVTPTPASQPPRTVEPWASPDEDATSKPVSTVVSVRRATVRIVSVVSILTDRRCANCYADRTNSDSYSHLRLRISKRHYRHHRQQRKIFQVSHTHLLALDRLNFLDFRSESPFQSLYVLERGRQEKVVKTGAAEFNHLRGRHLRADQLCFFARLVLHDVPRDRAG